MADFVVIKFLNESAVELVPKNWVEDENTVYWPPYTDSREVIRAAQKKAPVDSITWQKHSIEVLSGSGNYTVVFFY